MMQSFRLIVCLGCLVPALPALSAEPATPAAASPDTAVPASKSPSWLGIRLAAEAGLGQVTLPPVPVQDEPGGRYAALAGAWGFEGEGWVRTRWGVGLRLTRGFYVPFKAGSLGNSYALIEPQVLRRTEPFLFGPRKLIAVSWRASAGLGYSSVHTDRACGKHCDEIFVKAERVSASASTGGLVSVGPFGLYLGLRLVFDSSVDWSAVLNAAAGVEF